MVVEMNVNDESSLLYVTNLEYVRNVQIVETMIRCVESVWDVSEISKQFQYKCLDI